MTRATGRLEDAYEILQRSERYILCRSKAANPRHTYATMKLDAQGHVYGKLLREMNAQTKAVAYARRLDVQSKDDTQAAVGELKAEFFSALGTEHPELYRQLVAALERRQKGAQRG